MPALAHRHFSYAEYLAEEELSPTKHEYCNGAIVAMAGGTIAHAKLKTNLTGLLHAALSGRPCQPFDSDLRIRVLETTLATYPDLSVICGPPERDPEDRCAVTNPTALFEVLSPSSVAYDRGEKFDHYAHLASLRAYVIVDHTRPHIDVYARQDDGSFARRGYGAGQQAPIPGIDVSIDVDAVYTGWAEIQALESTPSTAA